MKNFILTSLFLFPLLGFSQGPRVAREAFHHMKDNEAVILDVREKWEIQNTGIAAGAKWIPISAIRFRKREWMIFLNTVNKAKIIYVYSRSGGRAVQVAQELKQRGLKSRVIGGLRDWKNAGLPIKKIGRNLVPK